MWSDLAEIADVRVARVSRCLLGLRVDTDSLSRKHRATLCWWGIEHRVVVEDQ